MGLDIYGWVEVKPYDEWLGVIRIASIMDRNNLMFEGMFGAKNELGFAAIADNRGQPTDISEESADFDWPTRISNWITWAEIEAIDWSQRAPDSKTEIFGYQRDVDGAWKLFGYGMHLSHRELSIGESIQENGILYKREYWTRQHVLDTAPDWRLLFDMMELLGRQYGGENVRMVVGFG